MEDIPSVRLAYRIQKYEKTEGRFTFPSVCFRFLHILSDIPNSQTNNIIRLPFLRHFITFCAVSHYIRHNSIPETTLILIH